MTKSELRQILKEEIRKVLKKDQEVLFIKTPKIISIEKFKDENDVDDEEWTLKVIFIFNNTEYIKYFAYNSKKQFINIGGAWQLPKNKPARYFNTEVNNYIKDQDKKWAIKNIQI
jgi:hypothetical protein